MFGIHKLAEAAGEVAAEGTDPSSFDSFTLKILVQGFVLWGAYTFLEHFFHVFTHLPYYCGYLVGFSIDCYHAFVEPLVHGLLHFFGGAS